MINRFNRYTFQPLSSIQDPPVKPVKHNSQICFYSHCNGDLWIRPWLAACPALWQDSKQYSLILKSFVYVH